MMKFENLTVLIISSLLCFATEVLSSPFYSAGCDRIAQIPDTVRLPANLYYPADTGYTMISDRNLYRVESGFLEFYRETDTTMLHRLYTSDGIDVTDSFTALFKWYNFVNLLEVESWSLRSDNKIHAKTKYSHLLLFSDFVLNLSDIDSSSVQNKLFFVADGYSNRDVPFAGAKVFRNEPWPKVIDGQASHSTSVNPDYVPEHKKHIKYCGNGDYMLSLSVGGDLDTVSELPMADIVLVVDLSSSMNFLVDTTSFSRLEVLKENLTKNGGFIDGLFNSFADINFSMVGFGGVPGHGHKGCEREVPYDDAVVISGWVSNKRPGGKYVIKRLIDSLQTNVFSFERNHNGTNVQAGLMMAGETITDSVSATRPDARKIVVLISDGVPTSFYGNGEDYLFNIYTGLRENIDSLKYGLEGMTFGHAAEDDMHSTSNIYSKWLEWATDIDSAGNAVWVRSDSERSKLMPSRRAWKVAETLGEYITDFYTIGCDMEDNYFLQGARERTGLANTMGFSSRSSEQLNGVFDSLLAVNKFPTLSGVIVEDALSDYVVVPDNVLEWNISINGEKLSSTEGVIKFAEYIPAEHKVRFVFEEDYAIDCRESYVLSFKVRPSEKAFAEFDSNLSNNDPTGYGGVVGGPDSDAPDNHTSSGMPGFYSNDNENVTLQYRFGDDEIVVKNVAYNEKPVIQVYTQKNNQKIIPLATHECVLDDNPSLHGYSTETDCHSFIDDSDGNMYDVVLIDGHCWMRENLRKKLPSAMAYRSLLHQDEETNAEKYGYLYSWESAANISAENPVAVEDRYGFVRGICPQGWHLPSAWEINSLRTHYSEALKSQELWLSPSGNTNATFFNALPAGFYNGNTGRYEGILGTTYYHSDSENEAFGLSYHCCRVTYSHKTSGNAYSVRCVKDFN